MRIGPNPGLTINTFTILNNMCADSIRQTKEAMWAFSSIFGIPSCIDQHLAFRMLYQIGRYWKRKFHIPTTQKTCYRQWILVLVRNCTVNNNTAGMKNMNLNHLCFSVLVAVPLYLLHESAW